MNIIRPYITLLVLAAVAFCCFLLMAFYPANGINVLGIKLRFKSLYPPTDTLQQNKIEDVEKFLAQFDSASIAIDTTGVDSTIKVERKATVASLQFRDNNSSSLFAFFEALDSAKATGKRVHIFHYGDSQIESDRMSNVIRQKLQEKFGGHGSGLVAPVPITASGNILQSQSSNWKRYTAYGFDDGKVTHKNYGVMCAFGKFTSPKKNADAPADTVDAWIELKPSSMATSVCKIYSTAILYFGNNTAPFSLAVYDGDQKLSEEIIPVTENVSSRSWNFANTPKKLTFKFRATDSPDIYGIELHGSGGVNLSNIALRGNDGGAFRRVNPSSMSKVFNDLDAELFILQFGGNAVPYLTSDDGAKGYGRAFRNHIQMLKRLCPKAAFIIVGPSDMSTSVDGVYQTWPHLEALRDGMKEAAFEEGCAFWDMFEVMGGRNSMVSWVTNNPPYAGPDYTHFTPAGARKVAELLYKAIDDEYEAWHKAANLP